MPGSDIGIDLGTATILVYIKGKGIVLKEPSVVAVDKDTDEIVAVGLEAQKMLGRTPGNIIAVRPLREGVISNFNLTEQMLKYTIKKVGSHLLFKPRMMICVPSIITEVEERAVVDAALQAGARKAYLIEEPVAAAIGAGIDISKPCGSMIVDIGGGTTDIAVLSLKDVAISTSIKVAGDKFDEAVVRYIRRRYNVLIGERTAEEVKIKIGCVYPQEERRIMAVKGRSLVTGLPKSLQVTSDEIMEAFEDPANAIYEAIHSVLESTPPELVGDISTNGILLTGGGSLIRGLDQLIMKRVGIPAHIAEDPVSCVAIGTGKALDKLGDLKDGLLYISKNKTLTKEKKESRDREKRGS
ncbi:MAG TPA: rod shape-determining protein MreB [Clostridia bacterium]|nr:rod shape-determining protein MreB [Clostridia bacterium]